MHHLSQEQLHTTLAVAEAVVMVALEREVLVAAALALREKGVRHRRRRPRVDGRDDRLEARRHVRHHGRTHRHAPRILVRPEHALPVLVVADEVRRHGGEPAKDEPDHQEQRQE